MSQSCVEALWGGFPGQCSVLCVDLDTGDICHSHQPEAKLPAGPMLAFPLLVCALEQVCRGRLALDQALDGGGTLKQGLADLAAGDARALEGVTALITPQRADDYFQGTLGLRDTACGPQARTSNQSLFYLFRRLVRGEVLTQPLRERLLALLAPVAPAPAQVGLAAQAGGLCHWAGLVPGPAGLRYVGVCSWEGPGGAAQRQEVENLVRALAGLEG